MTDSAASVAAVPKSRSAPVPLQGVDARSLLADRVEQLYWQLPLGVVATVVVSFIAAFELRAGRYAEIVAGWGALVLIISAARMGLYLYWVHYAGRGVVAPEQWLRWLGIAALASGATWGIAASVFFPSHADEQQVFLALLLTGAMAGGISMYAASWPMYAVYGAGIALPFTYVLATFGNRLFTEVAVLVPAFYAVCVAIAWRLNEVFDSGYRLRHAYRRLTDANAELNQRLQQQLAELTEARRQVEASGRKLALFVERSPIAVLELDPDGRIREINRAAELIFSYAPDEIVGESARRLVLPEHHAEFDAQWRHLIETREPLARLRLRNVRRDGIPIVCEWTVTPLVNPGGEVVSVIAQGRDITQELEAERVKKEFTSTLSHELRTPLTSIIGSLQLVNSGVMGEPDKEVLELTVVAERNAQRLLDLINDILDIEKIESGKLTLAPEPLALEDVLREALVLNRAFGERFRVRFELRAEPPSVRVHADRKRLLQVLTNLLSNAAKFSPEGGTVEVSLEQRGARVRVGVHDRGPGIPENFRARIFSRFAQAESAATRQKGGTGLGLAICKRLVEMMQGTIGFADREGGGTTFFFELPVLDAPAARAA
ncbi:MAG: HAMP domain-containing histidine kinase [Burkholderiales bacterium]|nr:HAMP domain-containing histidine kinase [Burkholderiales bacterium]